MREQKALLSCPFCGGAMQPRHALWPSDGDTDAVIHAEPTECGLAGGFSIGTADNGVSVAAAWNCRAAPPVVPEKHSSLPEAAALDLHPRTADLVDRFAAALKKKLADAEKKYGYSDGWADDGWMRECRAKLLDHIAKGDPRDVAAYCAFLWHHGERTSVPTEPVQRPGDHLQGGSA